MLYYYAIPYYIILYGHGHGWEPNKSLTRYNLVRVRHPPLVWLTAISSSTPRRRYHSWLLAVTPSQLRHRCRRPPPPPSATSFSTSPSTNFLPNYEELLMDPDNKISVRVFAETLAFLVLMIVLAAYYWSVEVGLWNGGLSIVDPKSKKQLLHMSCFCCTVGCCNLLHIHAVLAFCVCAFYNFDYCSCDSHLQFSSWLVVNCVSVVVSMDVCGMSMRLSADCRLDIWTKMKLCK